MKDNTKKWLVTAGLAAVCIGLVFGISKAIYREPEHIIQAAEIEAETIPIFIEEAEYGELTSERETEKELVIEIELQTPVDKTKQKIQKQPEKIENEKPQEAPLLSEQTDLKNPEVTPVYEEPKGEIIQTQENSAPAHGDTRDGMIYIEGFGWIEDEGGGGSGTVADNMYENGNKIGVMD